MSTIITPQNEDAAMLERVFRVIINEQTAEHAHIMADIFSILADDKTPDGIKLHQMTKELNHDGRNMAVVDLIGYLAILQRAHIIKLVALDSSNEPHIRMLKHDHCQT